MTVHVQFWMCQVLCYWTIFHFCLTNKDLIWKSTYLYHLHANALPSTIRNHMLGKIFCMFHTGIHLVFNYIGCYIHYIHVSAQQFFISMFKSIKKIKCKLYYYLLLPVFISNYGSSRFHAQPGWIVCRTKVTG